MPEEIAKFEITPEVEENLVDITQKWAYQVNDEYGILYHKLKKWYEKYGNYPTAPKIRQLIYFINVDISRVENKIRTIKGELVGSGVGVSLTSLDQNIDDSESNGASLGDIITDPSEALPNDIERFDLNLLFEKSKDLSDTEKLVLKLWLENKSGIEIAEILDLTESRISQIRRDLGIKLREAYREINLPVEKEKEPEIEVVPISKEAERLVKKKDEIEKKRDYILSKTKKGRYKINGKRIQKLSRLIYSEIEKSNLTPRQLCAKYGIGYDSFRATCSQLGLSLQDIKEKRKLHLYSKLYYKWREEKDNITFYKFCIKYNVIQQPFQKWVEDQELIVEKRKYKNKTKVIKKAPPTAKWYCLHVKSLREHIVARTLSNAMQIETFAPRISVQRVTARGKRKFVEPMFRGLFFAKFDLKDCLQVEHFPGVTGVLRIGEKIPPVPDFSIDTLKEEVHSATIEKKTFEEGDWVEIIAGSFKGYCTKVINPDIGYNRASLLIEMLGTATQINVNLNEIVKVK